MKCLLLCLVLLLIRIPDLQVIRGMQAVADQGKPVPITLMGPKRWETRTSFAPNSAVQDKFRLVVRDRATWLDLWKRIYRVDTRLGEYPKLPEVDFSREMLVVAALGQQPTSGYSIIKADSMADAVKMAQGCPVLMGGAKVMVFETFNVM